MPNLIFYLKKIISFSPKKLQIELKRIYLLIRIKLDQFNTDEPEYEILEQYINQGDWVIDVGANIGHYTCKFSKLVGQKGRVFSFEPSIDNFELLCSNVNTIGLNNVTLINAAASETFDTFGLSIPEFKSGLKNYYMASLSKEHEHNLVIGINIDILNFTNPIKLIKIDVEGHELQAINGMKNTIIKFKPTLIIEGHNSEIVSLLSELGYEFKCLKNSPNTVFLFKNENKL